MTNRMLLCAMVAVLAATGIAQAAAQTSRGREDCVPYDAATLSSSTKGSRAGVLEMMAVPL
jgi:hypothetical protein